MHSLERSKNPKICCGLLEPLLSSFILNFGFIAPLVLQPSVKLDHLAVSILFPKVATSMEVIAPLCSDYVFLCPDLSTQIPRRLAFSHLVGELIEAPYAGLAVWS